MNTISQIIIYPIKSCKGISLDSAEVTLTGLRHDRKFVLVDSDYKFLSQRRFPKMCLINTSIHGDILTAWGPGVIPHLILPLNQPPQNDPIPVNIWGKIGYGSFIGGFADAWFSKYLGVKCRLLRIDFRKPRYRNLKGPNDVLIPLSFADGFPILLIPEPSLADLNARMTDPVTMDRFRPSIVSRGNDRPFEEDNFKTLTIGTAQFRGEKLCERCSIIQVDPETGIPDQFGPLTALSEYRKIPAEAGAEVGPVMFGKNLSVEKPGRIFIGDEVIVRSYQS